jgi:putative oxidoreductase
MIKNRNIQKVLTGTNLRLLDSSLLILRCTIGAILFIVGSGKVLGWFGGFGFAATIQFYDKMGFSVLLTYLSSYTEFIGGILLILGFLTRPVSILVIINMTVATSVMLPHGFLGPGGASYPFAFLMIAIVILIAGPRDYSLDYLIFNKGKNNKLQ